MFLLNARKRIFNKKKVKWKSEENTKLINFYNKKYKNLIINKELNNNYNIEYTKLNKYNKIVYDTIENIFLYHNYNIIYNGPGDLIKLDHGRP